MGKYFLIILGVATVFGLGALIFSHEADPKERAKEAVGAAAGGAAASVGFLMGLILCALPAAVGIILLGLLMRSCS